MSNCKCNFLHDIDMFGKTPEFYYKRRAKKTTLIGRIFTILYFITYIAFFIYKLVKMLQRVDVTFYDTFAFTGETPSIHLNSDNFYGGFGILGETGDPIVNPHIYYATATFWKGVKNNGLWSWEDTNIPLETCKLEKFGKKYQDMFRDKDLDNMYCLSNTDFVLEGYATSETYSYFEVSLFPCIETTEDGLPCADYTIKQLFLKKNNFMFKMQDIELTPQDYKSPTQEIEKDISGPVYSDLKQQIYAYLQVTNIETDEDIIGFGLSNIKKEKFLKYDESWIISAPMEGDMFATTKPEEPIPFSVITVQLSEKALTQKRQYTTLIEVLGDVGGLMEVILTFVNIILSFIIDNLYEKSLINNLFEFDLDKKIIILKEKKTQKEEIIPNEEPNIIYSPINPMRQLPMTPQNSMYLSDDNTIQTKNKMNDEMPSNNKLNQESLFAPKNIKIKKKKKKKIKMPILNTEKIDTGQKYLDKLENEEKKVEINNIYELKEKGLDINNNKEKGMELGNNTENGNSERRIVRKIKVNKCFNCLCFLCARRKKSLENTLIDEGMGIVMDKLDIINLFRILLIDEKTKEKLKTETFEMSDACKVNIHDMINKIYNSWQK